MVPRSDNLIWLDLEMTGLFPEQDYILEIATVVTDKHLNVIAEGPVIAVHQSDAVLESMNDWCVKQHARSGLVSRVQESTVSEKQAEEATMAFLSRYVLSGHSPMCGNSICQDRRFLARWMPDLANFFHYRNLDVSTIKILAQHWAPEIINDFYKESTHLALQDIYDSIAELKFYREHFFKLRS